MTTPHPEILKVESDTHTVKCNGGGGALGHPVVYYTFDGQDEVVCGYCDRLFTRKSRKGAVNYADSAA